MIANRTAKSQHVHTPLVYLYLFVCGEDSGKDTPVRVTPTSHPGPKEQTSLLSVTAQGLASLKFESLVWERGKDKVN